MKTVKEISKLTGISARTLHCYEEIGLFHPSEKNEAGYRLYDDKALETLQQILFFREFDIPSKQIKAVMDNPSLDRNQILRMQRQMLVAKKDRMEQLIASVDEWKKHYIETVSSESMQKSYAKVVEWYGGKNVYSDTLQNPISKEVAESYKKREDAILRNLLAKRRCDINSFEIKALIGEYGFVMKQVCQMKEDQGLMLSVAKSYRNKQCQQIIDEQYGEGAAEFFAQAIEAFYHD